MMMERAKMQQKVKELSQSFAENHCSETLFSLQWLPIVRGRLKWPMQKVKPKFI